MALTILEAAKLDGGDAFKSGVVELYAGSSSILLNLPFESIAGNALKYNREGSLPGVGFRGVNEAYTPSTGVLNPLTEALVIAGGDHATLLRHNGVYAGLWRQQQESAAE